MHLGNFFTFPAWIKPLFEAGGLGVVFFFVLSGHVLAWKYQGKITPAGWQLAIREYAVRRFARIYPLYFLVLVIYLVIAPWHNDDREVYFLWTSWLAHVTATQAWLTAIDIQQYWNAPGWSISCELFFYAVFPLMMLARKELSKRLAMLIFGVYAIVVPVALFVLASKLLFPGDALAGYIWLNRMRLFGLVAFVAGVLLASADHTRLRPRRPISPLAPLFVLVSSIYLLDRLAHQFPYLGALFAVVLYTPLMLWLTYALAGRRNFLAGVLNHPLLELLGESSYALYITHWLFLPLVPSLIRLAGNHLLAFALALTGMTAVSITIHLLFERPVRNWINQRYASQ